ncbi:SDR family NAD(P)-dependent oxidoreductase [Larsenimonas rhizosphaerae]|uniref:SDR family NAD(P)-dependent oxidoreductase n=1 Tax=Larsenimonas rhizosphaerae TaxID=2944682 RepID=UPI00203358CD|nr:SDR family NAD(P)-dependent oxidoreductase [Larsenimonas rhizosphaerae]MCM2129685.1 SDR family NAD(P)-dependent oxidoreductase [Larsenimonas rhizosphaerae]
MSVSPVLITGGTRRLGRYCAERLMEDGHPVIITWRTRGSAVDALERLGARTMHADFSTREGIEAFIEALILQAPSLRAVIHNAGAAVEECEGGAEQFDRQFHTNMMAPYLVNLAAYDLLMASGEPQRDIIHLTDARTTSGCAHRPEYAAAKAGLDNLTRSFAKRFSPHIQVNAIAPGLVMQRESDFEQAPVSQRAVSGPVPPGPLVIWEGLRYLLDTPFVTGITLPVDGSHHVA